MRRLLRENGLSIVRLGLFFPTLVFGPKPVDAPTARPAGVKRRISSRHRAADFVAVVAGITPTAQPGRGCYSDREISE
jgi:hypothetical protein